MVEREKENLSEVENVLTDGGYTGKLCITYQRAYRRNSGSSQKKRAAHLCGAAETMGGRTIVRLA
jgi:hypothetical protein